MKFILGKKVKMTQIWQGDKVIPCTLVQAGPCFITQIKSEENDSYKAVQVSYGERKTKNISKPLRGHLKKALGREDVKYLREFRLKEDNPNLEIGKMIDVSGFASGDIVDVTGRSKGKGFQGVVKRYGFAGSQKTHGNKDQLRAPGSIGAKGPAHVFKGTRMAGRMGDEKVTTKNMEIVDVDLENNLLYIKGAVPGSTNSLVIIKAEGELLIKDPASLGAKDKVEESHIDTSGVHAINNSEEGVEPRDSEAVLRGDDDKVEGETKEVETKVVEDKEIKKEEVKESEEPKEEKTEVIDDKETEVSEEKK